MSSDGIRRFAARMLRAHAPHGRLLDFGAGRGNLLRELRRSGGYSELAGVDLYPREPELDPEIGWHVADLNEPVELGEQFDVVVCSEVIEHLENPRQVFRTLAGLLRPGGTLILTMPNQESIRSLLGLVARGHFTHFLNQSYPAHITALLRLDLERICAETGFTPLAFDYTPEGAVPGFTSLQWRRLSLGLLRGKLFSDGVGMAARLTSA